MKRWWKTPGRPAWAGNKMDRLGRGLMKVALAGAVSLPILSGSGDQVRLPRTGGAVIEAWAFGTLSDARQPNSQEGCDLSHVCALAISSAGGAGTGTGATIKTLQSASQGDLPSNLPFALTETIEYAHPITKGEHGNNGQGACYPGTGVMTIAADASSILVLDIVGQACQVGTGTAQLVFTGSYVTDEASSGVFAHADAIGSVNINNPSGLPGTHTWLKASLVGQLLFGN